MTDPAVLCRTCEQPLDLAIARQGQANHPTCPPLQVSVDVVASELFALIADGLVNSPRSRQREIGPSEAGSPCHRRIGYKMAGTPAVNESGVAWKPAVGTAVHAMFADIVARAEADRAGTDLYGQRWHVEQRVSAGEYGPDGVTLDGNCDLFDAWTGTSIDWKFTTRSQIRSHYRPHGPGDQYRTQAHLYGYGWARAGHPVAHVAVVFLTRDGEYTDRYVWHEPYDEQVALGALDRLSQTAHLLRDLGPDVALPLLPVAESFCSNCPWFARGATDPPRSCPGVSTTKPAPATLAAALT